MKILVVEDDSLVTQTLQLLLSSYGYAVDIATDGEIGLQMANAFNYDLLLLDVMLPRGNGVSLCQQLRAEGCQVPILLLTGQGEGRQKAIALNAGADDYLVKPFDPDELVARIQALLRRGGPSTQPVLSWGLLSLDPDSRKVSYGTHLITTTPKEYAILELFLRNPQKPLNAKAILDHVWTSLEPPGEESVRVHIKELRQKLRIAGASPDFIETKHRLGYRLNSRYSDLLATQVEQQPTNPKIAELAVVNEELRQALEELQVAQEELQQQNDELQAARQSLELERRHYQNLFDFAPDAYLLTDLQGLIQRANHAASALLQVEPHRLVGKPLTVFIDLPDRPDFRHCLNSLDFPPNWELTITPREGDSWSVLVAVTVNRNLQHEAVDLQWALRDICVRKASEQQLQAAYDELETALGERERQLSSLVNNLPGYLYQVQNDLNYTPIFISQGVSKVTGYRQEDYLIHRTISCGQEIVPEDAESVWNIVQQAIASRQPYECEYRIVTKDGTQKWVWEHGQGVYAADGSLNYLEGFVIDITDRKQAELALQQSEARFRHFAENSRAVLWVAQPGALDTVYVSPAYEQVWGYSVQSCRDRPDVWLEAIHPEDREYVQQQFQQWSSAEGLDVEYRIVQPDGSIHWIWDRAFKIRNDAGQVYSYGGFAEDITERKQLELSLRDSEAKLSQVVNRAIAAISSFHISSNRDWAYEYFSAGFEAVFGYTPQELMADHQLWLSQVWPDDRETVLMPLFDSFFAERDVTAEFRFNHKDGSTRWISSTYTSQRIDEDCWLVTVVSSDISARKQAEIVLQQQIRQEYLLADMAQDIRRSLNLDEVLSRTVDRVREVLNADRVVIFRFRPNWQGDVVTESVGTEWLSLLPTTIVDPCFSDRYVEPYRQGRTATLTDIDNAGLEPCYVELLKSFQVKANLVVPIFQGETLWGLLITHQCSAPRQWQPAEVALLKRLATQVGIAIQQSELYGQTQQELAAREQMQRVLEASEERFRSLSAAAPVGIIQTNADGICLYSNACWQGMSELSFEASLGGGWLQAIHPEDRDVFQQAWETCLQGNQEDLPEVRLQTPQGGIRWIVTRSAVIRSAMGEIMGHVCVCLDITEQKQLEAQFHQAQRLESLGRLASGIAHDLNNILTPILAIAYMLRLQQTSLDKKAQDQLKLIEDSAKRGASMVKQILTLTRSSNGEKTVVSVATVLQDVIHVLQESLPKSVEIYSELPEQDSDHALKSVLADSTQLSQVFMNLCVNARDALPRGGRLTITAENTVVDEAIAQTNLDAQVGNYVVVTITDTGMGIAPEVRDRIFDPFFTTKEPGKGTGLGLSMVLSIVKNHGGFLQVFSAPGQGTQMKVFLPALETTALHHEGAERSPEERWYGHGELVLIVDDDQAVQQTTQALLEDRHYNTLIANDGVEAIALYQHHQADIRLVLLDITMPKMSGIELIRRLKSINPDVHIIAISGLLENQKPSVAAGANAFLAKPYMLDDLLKLVHQLK